MGKKKRTTRLPRYTRDPVVGVWSEALGDLQERSPEAEPNYVPCPGYFKIIRVYSFTRSQQERTRLYPAICAYYLRERAAVIFNLGTDILSSNLRFINRHHKIYHAAVNLFEISDSL